MDIVTSILHMAMIIVCIQLRSYRLQVVIQWDRSNVAMCVAVRRQALLLYSYVHNISARRLMVHVCT